MKSTNSKSSPKASEKVKMNRSKAFLVVGHRNWGKSKTLRALTNDEYGWVTLHGKHFFIRFMSNDDVPSKYSEFIEALDPTKKPLVIVAYCPEQSPYVLIDAISKKYDLFIWVLQHNYGCTREISESETATAPFP